MESETLPPRLTDVPREEVDLDRLPPTVSAAEAAHILGCHVATVRQMLRRDDVPEQGLSAEGLRQAIGVGKGREQATRTREAVETLRAGGYVEIDERGRGKPTLHRLPRPYPDPEEEPDGAPEDPPAAGDHEPAGTDPEGTR